jgi:hypothetical protein
MPKFASASKCELLGLKWSICEYEKGHRRSTKLLSESKQVSDLNSTIGALKVIHLKPGAQVSVNHFEPWVLVASMFITRVDTSLWNINLGSRPLKLYR